jgi:predicted amidophosphoribosyltransferase
MFAVHREVFMTCGYCGYEFPEEEGIKGCGKCGRPGSCHMLRCPRCFYENPQEPLLVSKIRRMMKK